MDRRVAAVNQGEVLDAIQGLDFVVRKLAARPVWQMTRIILADLDTQDLTLYAAPDESSPVVGVVEVGQPFQLLDRDNSNNWYQICCVEQRSGWVNIVPLATDDVQ